MTVKVDEFADRLFKSALGTAEILSIHIGDRMGWYRALAAQGPATPGELVARAGGGERYAREWLEQQAIAGILTVGDDGRFVLGEGEAEVLTDESSLAYLAPMARLFTAAAVQMPALLEAYRTGGGVSWADFGTDMRESQADMNRPWFEHALPGVLAGLPELDAVLRRPGARIADIGCGGGWSTIALARAYPQAHVEGIDIDAPSIELATRNAAEAGLGDRVAFRHGDAAGLGAEQYDAIFAFECVHDMPRPVDTLAAARRALAPGGVVVVMDEAVADSFAPPGDEIEQLMYGFSLLVCLPDGMAHRPSAGTGTVMRPDTLRRYAREAGFRDLEILPVEDFGFWRFYRLIP
ncbi:class I SAM-dependent methyltransferase [Thermoactinospora rubra]|uniref:class I SAM-dependent methyltransferase n=1 Tax=Thermoactinospora rubra TaxID=1088767 RepID=UPI000A10DC47|nr:class I SAM-dependent methyltransferase [Thermoactinospora rubra]